MEDESIIGKILEKKQESLASDIAEAKARLKNLSPDQVASIRPFLESSARLLDAIHGNSMLLNDSHRADKPDGDNLTLKSSGLWKKILSLSKGVLSWLRINLP